MSIFCSLLANRKNPTKESVACTKESFSPARFQSNWGSWSETDQNWKFLNFQVRISAKTWEIGIRERLKIEKFYKISSSIDLKKASLEIIIAPLKLSTFLFSIEKESDRGHGSCSSWLVFRYQPTRGMILLWRRIPSSKGLWDPPIQQTFALVCNLMWVKAAMVSQYLHCSM